jgi:hypothetical protein
LWVPRTVLELHFQTTAELVEIDLRPIDAEFAANPLGRGGTYPLFFGFRGCVLSVFDFPCLIGFRYFTNSNSPGRQVLSNRGWSGL